MFREFLNGRGNDVELCGMFIGVPDHSHSLDRPPRDIIPYELPNRARKVADNYVIRQGDVRAALEADGLSMDDVVGFWHTHPQPYLPGPSQADWDSIMLGAKHWWHCVVHPESWTLTWYDYYGNVIEEKDNEHGTRPLRRERGARMAGIRGPRQSR